MATFYAGEMEELKTCPYNPSHRIAAKRYVVHLVKCRKSHPDVNMVTCPFSAEHVIGEPELAYHLEVCQFRKLLEVQLFPDAQIEKKWEVQCTLRDESDEVWEIDDNRPSYNPQAYCEKNRVIRTMSVQPPKVRKQFRLAERERHQQLDRLEQDRRKEAEKREKIRQEEISERERGTTTGASIYTKSDSEDHVNTWFTSWHNRRNENDLQSIKSDETETDDQLINKQKLVPLKEKNTYSTTASEREYDDTTSLCSSFSTVTLAEDKEEPWVKVTNQTKGRGRGRGRKLK